MFTEVRHSNQLEGASKTYWYDEVFSPHADDPSTYGKLRKSIVSALYVRIE